MVELDDQGRSSGGGGGVQPRVDLGASALELSREFALAVDAAGVVVWLDARAERTLRLGLGSRLVERAIEGTGDKLSRLVHAALAAPVDHWELVLNIGHKPVTVTFCGKPVQGAALLLGSLVPQDYGTTVEQLSSALSEVSTLHRESASQQRRLVEANAELSRVNRALTDSSRGLVALHAELDDKDVSLREATEVRTRMVANVGHELRTPLNSILGLSRLLLSRVDGELTAEQEKQLGFIRHSAQTLSDLVDDLLDLSKFEAGKQTLRASEFAAQELFSSLRGMLTPLVVRDGVRLEVEEPARDLRLETDEGKLGQVLRNLASNALKFTERGQVSIRSELRGERVHFEVVDTGIGIANKDLSRIFEEFTQLESPLQRKAKGTGLGLWISRRLVHLLGGELRVESTEGKGSRFSFEIPRRHPEVAAENELRERALRPDPQRAPVLVVEDDRQTLFLYEKYLSGAGFQVIPARSVDEARATLKRLRPAAVVLDVMLEGESTWGLLGELKNDPATRDIPTLVVTVMGRENRARALGADEFTTKPIDQEWLLSRLAALAQKGPVDRVLVIDDDDVSRYVIRRLLDGTSYKVLEAASGAEGVKLAQEELPQVIFLDFVLGEETAFEVLDELKADPRTRCIPVILSTSMQLMPQERARLEQDTSAILSKQSLSREVALARIRDALVKSGLGPPAK